MHTSVQPFPLEVHGHWSNGEFYAALYGETKAYYTGVDLEAQYQNPMSKQWMPILHTPQAFMHAWDAIPSHSPWSKGQVRVYAKASREPVTADNSSDRIDKIDRKTMNVLLNTSGGRAPLWTSHHSEMFEVGAVYIMSCTLHFDHMYFVCSTWSG